MKIHNRFLKNYIVFVIDIFIVKFSTFEIFDSNEKKLYHKFDFIVIVDQYNSKTHDKNFRFNRFFEKQNMINDNRWYFKNDKNLKIKIFSWLYFYEIEHFRKKKFLFQNFFQKRTIQIELKRFAFSWRSLLNNMNLHKNKIISHFSKHKQIDNRTKKTSNDRTFCHNEIDQTKRLWILHDYQRKFNDYRFNSIANRFYLLNTNWTKNQHHHENNMSISFVFHDDIFRKIIWIRRNFCKHKQSRHYFE